MAKRTAMLEKPETPEATDQPRGHRTFNPLKLALCKLEIEDEEGLIKVRAKLDDNNSATPDEFTLTSMEIPPYLADEFKRAFERLQILVLKGISSFQPFGSITLTYVERNTKGKGEKKKDIYIFKASDPSGPVKNTIVSGEITLMSLPEGLKAAFDSLEAVLLPIYQRERFPQDQFEQKDLLEDGEEGLSEEEEALDE